MLNHKPKVSVIMPTYNGVKFIKKSIDGVLSQTFKDFELIIINDGSCDNTKDIVKSYIDKRIIYLENKKNVGVSKTRNKGLKHARGEYIAYCDHDDIYYPNHLERMAYILDRNQSIGLVYAKYLIIQAKLKAIIAPAFEFQKEKELVGFFGVPLNVMHRKTCIEKVGGFDESNIISKHGSEDTELWLRISDYFSFYHLNEILGEHILHGGNRIYSVDSSKAFEYIIKKLWRKQNTRIKQINYIKNVGIAIIKCLLNHKRFSYAWKLAQRFHVLQKNYQTYACLGFCNLTKGNFHIAIAKFKKAIQLASRSSIKKNKQIKDELISIKNHLALSYLHAKKIKKAVNLCKRIIYIDKYNVAAKQILSLIEIMQFNYIKPLKLLSSINEAYSRYLCGVCYFYLKKFKQAIKEFETAIAYNPKLTAAYYNLRICYLQSKKYLPEKMLFPSSLNIKWGAYFSKVSVILPSYNRPDILGHAIQSVLNQTLKDFELIIINDGSTDNTEDIVSKFKDKRIVYLKKTHAGPASARNLGLKYAAGEYIAYLDDDDIYYSNHLKELVKFLDSHPDIGMVYSDFLMVSPENKRLGEIRCVFNKKGLETKCLFSLSTVMHRRHCLDRAGFFDEKLLKCQDWDMWLRISDFYKISYLPKLLTEYTYCVEPQSKKLTNKFYKTVIKKRIRKAKQEKQILEYIDNYAIQAIKGLISYNNLNYACRLAKEFYKIIKNYNTVACLGLCNLAKGKFKKAQSQFKSSLMKLPKNWRKLDPWYVEKILNIVIHLAEAYYNLNNILPAERLYKRALNIMPRNTFLKAKEGLAKCYINCGLFDDALNLLRQYNHSSLAYNLRGICYFKNGHYKRAIRELETALIFEPDSEIYRHNLATIQKVINAKT